MSSTTYFVLPDQREYQTSMVLANERIRARNVSGAEYHRPFGPQPFTGSAQGWLSFGVMEPDEMLALLRQVDWVHPVLVVYRTEFDHSWSFVTLGLSSPWMGEEDAA